MHRKKGLMVLVITLLVFTMIVACTPARRPMENNTPNINNNTMNTPGVDGLNPDPGRLPNGNNGRLNNGRVMDNGIYNNQEADMTINQQLERRIAREVEKINGVNDAVVIVNGNVAYVGIDAGRNITGDRTNQLKDQIIERVRKVDNGITRVYVSADMDVMERLRGFGRDIETGRPVSGFIDEIEELFRRPLPRTK